MVSGLPGFVRPADRVKQLEQLKTSTLKNIAIGQNLMKENNFKENKKSLRFRTNKPKKELDYNSKSFA